MYKIIKLTDNIYQIKTARVNFFFVIQNKNVLIIDSGIPSSINIIKKALSDLDFTLNDVSFFVGTHAHYDHIGSTSELIKENPNIIIYMTEIDAKIVDSNFKTTPKLKSVTGYGKLVNAILKNPLPIKTNPIKQFKINEYLTQDSKIKGFENITIINLPGHTYGQIGLIINDNQRSVFLGADAFRSSRGLDLMFIYADIELALKTLLKLNDLKVDIIGVGHGKPILENTEIEINKLVEKAKKKLKEIEGE